MAIYVVYSLEYLFSLNFASRPLKYTIWHFHLLTHERLSCLRIRYRTCFGNKRRGKFLLWAAFNLDGFAWNLMILKLKLCTVDKLHLFRMTILSFYLLRDRLLSFLILETWVWEYSCPFSTKRIGFRMHCFPVVREKLIDLFLQLFSSHVVVVSLHQLKVFESFGFVKKSFRMVYIDESVLHTSYIVNRALNLFNHA